jgi:hypothetical protein
MAITKNKSTSSKGLSSTLSTAVVSGKARSGTNKSSVVEIENPQFDVHDMIGVTSGRESYVSLPANRINIPEVRRAKAEFVYNYFVKDERVKKSTGLSKDKILDLGVDFSNEIFFQMSNDRMPRYVKLSFKPPKTYGIIKKSTVSKFIEDNLDKITIEGASSNTYFTGIEFIDTGKEKEIYSLLNSTMFFTDIVTAEGSPQDAAEALYDTLEEKGGLFGKDKRLLKEGLSNMQSSGYVLAASDVPPEIAEFSDDPLTKQNFSVQFNNLTISETVKTATRIPDTVFQDEFRALDSFSEGIKTKMLKTVNPSKISDTQYEMTVKAVEIKTLSDKTLYPNRTRNVRNFGARKGRKNYANRKSLYDKYPQIKLAGYIIQKYEVDTDESTTFLGTMYSNNTNGLYIVDKDVRYGGNYIYKIRTIAEVDTIVTTSTASASQNSLSSFAIAKMLVASEGATVSATCTEYVPPPPPENLRIGFNFRRKLPFLSWQFPLNVQRDIKRFQIFKRKNLRKPFTLIAELDFDDSVIRGGVAEIALEENVHRTDQPRVNYLDKTFNLGDTPIYAIASVDAHGMSSNYSAQIRMRYNKYTNKLTTKVLSGPNAPKPYPNLLLNVDAFDDAIKVSGYERMKVFFDPEYYKVYKNEKGQRGERGKVDRVKKELSVNFLRVNPNVDTYKIHIMNLDLQKDRIVGVRIADFSGAPIGVSPASFSTTNLSFEFGT